MSKYIRFQQGVNTKGELIPYDKDFILKEIGKHSSSDWYRSLFHFDEDAYNYFKDKGSIAGFKGEGKTDTLVFDFDSKEDIDKAKADAIELLTRLQKGLNVGNSASAFFSGGKGFHIELLVDREYTTEEVKEICSTFCYNLESFDSVIYNTTRLYRLPNTKHQKTGLYKIELNLNDLVNLSIEDILDKAKAKSELLPYPEPCDANLLQSLYEEFKILRDSYLKHNQKSHIKYINNDNNSVEEIDGIRGISTIDFSKMPKNMPRCIYALQHGIMVPGRGERNELFRALAVYYRNQGHPKRATHGLLKSVAALNAELYPEHEPYSKEEIWNTVVSSAYSGNFKQIPGAIGISSENEVIKRYCDAVGEYTEKKCLLHDKTMQIQTTVQIDEVSKSFNRFASDFDKNTVKTGIGLIDNYMNIAVGTTTLIAGASGSGKTSLCLEILEHSSAAGQHCMFFSLDMHKNLVYLKLGAKLTNYTQKQIMDFYKNKNQTKINEVRNAIANAYNNVYFDFSSTLTMEQMRDKVLETEQQNGAKIKLVLVDYASRVSGPYSDKHANASYNALKSPEIADVTDAAWIYIAQVARQSGNGATPLRTKRVAKDTGDWEESATNVITVWRPFMGIEGQDDIMRIFLAKNRMGKEIERPLHWDGEKARVWDMSEEQLEAYIAERESAEKEVLKRHFSGRQ